MVDIENEHINQRVTALIRKLFLVIVLQEIWIRLIRGQHLNFGC